MAARYHKKSVLLYEGKNSCLLTFFTRKSVKDHLKTIPSLFEIEARKIRLAVVLFRVFFICAEF